MSKPTKDPRYAKWWRKTATFTRSMTLGQCSLCLLRRAKAVHHAYYGVRPGPVLATISLTLILLKFHTAIAAGSTADMIVTAKSIPTWQWASLAGFVVNPSLPIPGLEIPGWQIFPLCDRCHSNSRGCAHHRRNYQATMVAWFNSNTTPFLWRLRIGFAITLILVWGWPFIAIAILNSL